MSQHQTRDWSATIESTGYPSTKHKLVVKGEVQTLTTAEHPALKEAVPPGINPRILLLDLAIPSSGIGGDIVQWRTISFEKSVSAHQYDEVEVKSGAAKSVAIKVKAVVAAQ